MTSISEIEIWDGNVLELACQLPPQSVNAIITSPPYYFKRDYNLPNVDWGDWSGQLGLEPTFEMYLGHLLNVFHTLRPSLTDDGNLFVNLGDTYATHASSSEASSNFGRAHHKSEMVRSRKKPKQTVPEKCLCLIPQRFAAMMVADGWILRNWITWHKSSAPEGGVPRFYQSDQEVILFFSNCHTHYFRRDYANLWSIWNIPSASDPDHRATFPIELPLRCLRAGCPSDGLVLDPFSGSGTTLHAAKQLGMRGIGFELNTEYAQRSRVRLEQVKPFTITKQTILMSGDEER